jgi:hypothetical protein
MLPRTWLPALLCLLAFPYSAVADPTPFETTSGVCHPATGTSAWSFPLGYGWQQLWDLRVSVDGGPATWQDGGTDTLSWDGPAVDWSTGWDSRSSDVLGGTLSCAGAATDVHYTVGWYELPDSGTTFSGQLRPGGQSELGFLAQDDGSYTADVSVSGGSMQVSHDGTGPTLSSTGTLDFSTTAGPDEVDLDNVGGTPLTYTVTVAEVPAGLQLLSGSKTAYVRPGTSLTYGYRLNVPAQVNAWVHRSDNTVVRHLVSDDPEQGDNSVTWDGRDDAGKQVPEGRYTLSIGAWNSRAGDTVDSSVTVEATPPKLIVHSTASGRILVLASDSPSGILGVNVTIDGVPAQLDVATGSYSVPNLPLGKHAVHVVATDRAGNAATQDLTLTKGTAGSSAAPAPTPPCNDLVAGAALFNAKRFTAAIARTAKIKQSAVPHRFTPARKLCLDLNGDGVRDMAVLYQGSGHLAWVTPLAVYVGAPRTFTYA